jgi:long-chain acyl-CoA synthetase
VLARIFDSVRATMRAPPAPRMLEPMPNATFLKPLPALLPDAVERFPDRVAVRHRADGAWHDVTFAEVSEIVTELGLGLLALGVAPGDRVALLCATRPEWTYCDLAITLAGAVVVPIYPTSSPEECEWVLADSGAVAVIAETPEQLELVRGLRGSLPALRDVVAIDALDSLLARGGLVEPEALAARGEAVALDDPYTIIYTSGTTGRAKGCVLTHHNYRAMLEMVRAGGLLGGRDDLTYLHLPLAHAFALLMMLWSVEIGGAVAYTSGPDRLLADLAEVRPTFLPSVPRVFEKLHAALADAPAEHVRAAFGGRLRKALTGAAPIAPDVLEFFWDRGVPLLEGYGMTEAATGIAIATLDAHRPGTVGHALPGLELEIASDGEILVRGPNVFAGYHGEAPHPRGAWLRTGDLGALDADGFLTITGRKKDIIITAGGKNLTPANLERDLKRSRYISEAVMHGDRRPYPVALITLDAQEIALWAQARGLPEDVATLSSHPSVRALIQAELDRVNAHHARVSQIKRFAILDHDLTIAAGELTPTLKVRRAVVNAHYAATLDALYR